MITLRQIRFLVALADELNFSRAAEVCFVTQPTLSQAIQELEGRLGVQLVERTRRSVMLTPAGAEIAARGRALLRDAAEIETLAKSLGNPHEGDLHLGLIPTIGPYLMPRALPALRKAFPRLRIYLREDVTERLIERLAQGRLDVILIALPYETGALEIHPLFEDGYQLATPLHAPPPSATGEAALSEAGQLMLLESGHCLQRHALQAYPHRPLEQDESFSATSLGTLISMVSEGLGVTLLPDLAIKAGVAATGEVRLTPLPDARPRQIVLAWRPNSARKALFLSLADLLLVARKDMDRGS